MNSSQSNPAVQLIHAWTVASQLLRIEVIAPFTLRRQKESVDCIAFLPHFGSRQGVVVGMTLPPDFEVDHRLIKFAEDAGMFYSFINTESYASYDEPRYKETLKDWGFFGPPDIRPSWLVDGN